MNARLLWASFALFGLLTTGLLPAARSADAPANIPSLEEIAEARPAPALPERSPRDPVPRVWPHQPPVIPHEIRDYQVDRRHNRCLDCHQGAGSQLTGAKPVPATHYVNRDSETLDRLAGARYFCTFCHVPQLAAPLLTDNRFGEGPVSLPSFGPGPASQENVGQVPATQENEE